MKMAWNGWTFCDVWCPSFFFLYSTHSSSRLCLFFRRYIYVLSLFTCMTMNVLLPSDYLSVFSSSLSFRLLRLSVFLSKNERERREQEEDSFQTTTDVVRQTERTFGRIQRIKLLLEEDTRVTLLISWYWMNNEDWVRGWKRRERIRILVLKMNDCLIIDWQAAGRSLSFISFLFLWIDN